MHIYNNGLTIQYRKYEMQIIAIVVHVWWLIGLVYVFIV